MKSVIDRILEENKSDATLQLQELMDFLNKQNAVNKIALPVFEGLHFVDVDQIIRCEAQGNYCTIYLNGGKKMVISKTIKHIGELINNSAFIRVHQSHLVNLNYVSKYIRGKTGQLILEDGVSIPVSRSQKENLLNRF